MKHAGNEPHMHKNPFWGLLLAILTAGPAVQAAHAFTCTGAPAQGATVDTESRCRFFKRFTPDGTATDERISKNLHLKPGEKARSIALVLGISQYKNPDFTIPAAQFDIEHLKKFLIENQKFDEVIVIENADATVENIRYFLRTYILRRTNLYEGHVRFLFAYTGHGVPVSFPYGDPEEPDAKKPSVGLALAAIESASDYQNIYGLNELRPLLADIAKNAFHVLALINACYGGDLFTEGAEGGHPDTFFEPGGRALTAGPEDLETQAAPDGNGSLFFNTIIQGIETGDADHEATLAAYSPSPSPFKGIVRLGVLSSYVSTQMIRQFGLEKPQLTSIGNLQPWLGVVEPFNVQARGGFFFPAPSPYRIQREFQA